MPFFKSRIHESVAVAALLAASASLHTAWILNLIWYRSNLIDSLESLYLFVASVYAIIFFFSLAFCKGRDCSSHRDRAYHTFLVSTLIFIAMTLPIVYGFAV